MSVILAASAAPLVGASSVSCIVFTYASFAQLFNAVTRTHAYWRTQMSWPGSTSPEQMNYFSGSRDRVFKLRYGMFIFFQQTENLSVHMPDQLSILRYRSELQLSVF